MAGKTNAVRLVESAGISYEVRRYDLAMGEFSASRVAELIGMPAGQVFKTLVAVGDDGAACFAVIPADSELNLKALARHSRHRKMVLAALRDVRPLTGYERGAVTVIGSRKPLPVFLDSTAVEHETIAVSAGARGRQLLIATDDYLMLTGASLVPIARH